MIVVTKLTRKFIQNMILALWIAIVLIVIDQWTKYLFYDQGIGADFSFLSPLLNTWISRWLDVSYLYVLPITFVALCVFFFLLLKSYISRPIFVLFVAGAIGNLIDRVVYEWVRDFIPLFSRFVFNIADLYLTIAVLLILIDEWKQYHLSRLK